MCEPGDTGLTEEQEDVIARINNAEGVGSWHTAEGTLHLTTDDGDERAFDGRGEEIIR